jgi:NIMA (never in mitosis gene a)-related kinase
VSLRGLDARQQHDAVRECQLLAALDSPFIVRYFDSFLEGTDLNIVMEFCEGGDVSQLLAKHAAHGTFLAEKEVWRLFLETVIGVHELHRRHILHRDLKTMNLFLDRNSHIKIGDLGVAKMLSGTDKFAQTIVGTPYYLS